MGLMGIIGEWRPHTWFSPELSGTDSQMTWTPPRQRPPDLPGDEHSRAASSTRPRPFMAAGNMLQAGLGKGRGLRDRKSTRLNSSHRLTSRMPSSA